MGDIAVSAASCASCGGCLNAGCSSG